MQEDAILVKQTILENKEAFHQLVRKYRASIYTMILSKVRNVDDAQDINSGNLSGSLQGFIFAEKS